MLKVFVIPECLWRESSGIANYQVTGSPTQAFGDDEYVFIIFDAFIIGLV